MNLTDNITVEENVEINSNSDEITWIPLYCIQLYHPTKSDNGIRHLIKNIQTNEIYEEKIEIKAFYIKNEKQFKISYYDKKLIK